jgi:hypothetical protein
MKNQRDLATGWFRKADTSTRLSNLSSMSNISNMID